jgi:hypothetical protein
VERGITASTVAEEVKQYLKRHAPGATETVAGTVVKNTDARLIDVEGDDDRNARPTV